MDNETIIKKILVSYEDIALTGEKDDIIFFQYKNKEYGCWYPNPDLDTSKPVIVVKNDESYNYPHVLPFSIPLEADKKDKYRYICLHESESTIMFLQSREEKMRDSIEQLISLLSLSSLEQEREFQKEFVYYWDNIAINTIPIQIYLRNASKIQKLNVYLDEKGAIRCVANGIKLSDANKKKNGKRIWAHKPELPGFYIPIEDKRRILPPTRDKKWTTEDILKIVCGKDIRRISHGTYQQLNKEKIKTQKMCLVFGMEVNGNDIFFATIIAFQNAKNETVMNKLCQDITEIQIISCRRIDYQYLCKQIGNDTSLFNKKILLIGAGSLGSYTARELIRAGIRDITIYDADKLEKENLLRHTCNDFWTGYSKVGALKYELEALHPEIHIDAINRNINALEFVKILPHFDLAIVTVGSSDVQLELNQALKKEHGNRPVVYTWLEAGGIFSHILIVDDKYEGCFQCLFTDADGKKINNKVNQSLVEDIERNKIRNGCGGTRAAYGNAILLRTTSVLLNTLQELFDGRIIINKLIDITPTQVKDMGNNFKERKCQCCNDENN